MGATTTQGTGNGGAWTNKGPGNGRSQFVPMVGPRLMRAGTATLTTDETTSVATVGFPPLAGDDADYVVMLVPVGATAAIAAAGAAVNSFDASAGTFIINGAADVETVINWAIFKI